MLSAGLNSSGLNLLQKHRKKRNLLLRQAETSDGGKLDFSFVNISTTFKKIVKKLEASSDSLDKTSFVWNSKIESVSPIRHFIIETEPSDIGKTVTLDNFVLFIKKADDRPQICFSNPEPKELKHIWGFEGFQPKGRTVPSIFDVVIYHRALRKNKDAGAFPEWDT